MTWRAWASMASAVVVVTTCGACGVVASGSFDGVVYAPIGSSLAIAQRHVILDRSGALTPVLQGAGAQTLDVLLTAAAVDVTTDWRRLRASALLDLKRDLAAHDGLLLKNVPLARAVHGDTLTFEVVGGAVVQHDFDATLALSSPNTLTPRALGTHLTVTLVPSEVTPQPHGGFVHAKVHIVRTKDVGQGDDVATGEVVLSVDLQFGPERLSESNLTVAEPVLRCAADAGPSASGACRDVDALPYVDETGTVN